MKLFLCLLVFLTFVGLMLQTCKGSLIITLLEPGNQSVTISVEVNQIRPLHLVTGRTYHIMCRDDSPHGEFDHSYLNVWWHCGVPVTKLSSTHFPDSDQAAVYSSTQVDVMVANEWTLVLQNLGEQPTEVGVYSCRDLQGRNVSLDIKESSVSIIAGVPDRVLIAQDNPTSVVVSLTSFISPPLSSSSSIFWLFNGALAPGSLPMGATVVHNEIFLRSPIRREMGGNYTCVLMSATMEGTSVSAVFVVAVHAPPLSVLSPDIKFQEVFSFQRSQFSVLCTDTVGFPMSYSVMWNWNGGSILEDDRISVTTNISDAGYTAHLLIDTLLSHDVGEYLCRAQNTIGVSEQTFSLTHVLAVSVLHQRMMWLEGETITFQVSLSSSSSFSSTLLKYLQSQWLKDGRALTEHALLRHNSQTAMLSNGSILITMEIMDAVHTDSGMYSCHLRSAVGMQMVTFDTVTVLGLSVTSAVYPTKEVLVPGLETHIVCQAIFSHFTSIVTEINMEVVWGREDGRTLGVHIQISETKILDSPSSRVYQTNLTFSPLIGGDEGEYICSVRCMFNSDGLWLVRGHTRSLAIDSVFFQLRMVRIGRDCQEWVGSEIQSKADTVVSTIVTQVSQLCPSCALTSNHITSAVFRCFPESPLAVTFRGRLHGTKSASSLTLLEYVHVWVEKGGVIPVNFVLTLLDGSCPLLISSLGDVECEKNVSSMVSSRGSTFVVVLGVGVAMAIVLVLLVVVISVLLLYFLRHKQTPTNTDKNKREKDIPVSASNPAMLGTEAKRAFSGLHMTTSDPYISEVLEGTVPQYEEIDKFMLCSESCVNDVKSVELLKISSSQATNYTYDYAAV